LFSHKKELRFEDVREQNPKLAEFLKKLTENNKMK